MEKRIDVPRALREIRRSTLTDEDFIEALSSLFQPREFLVMGKKIMKSAVTKSLGEVGKRIVKKSRQSLRNSLNKGRKREDRFRTKSLGSIYTESGDFLDGRAGEELINIFQMKETIDVLRNAEDDYKICIERHFYGNECSIYLVYRETKEYKKKQKEIQKIKNKEKQEKKRIQEIKRSKRELERLRELERQQKAKKEELLRKIGKLEK